MNYLIGVLSIIMLAGCNGIGSISPTQGAGEMLVPTITFTPTKSISTSTAPATEISPTVVEDPVVKKCLPVNENMVNFADVAPSGTLAVYDKKLMSAFLLDLETGTQYPLPFKTGEFIPLPVLRVSPTGKYMAYVEDVQNLSGDIVKQVIGVIDNKGTVLISQSVNPEILFTNWRWLDERLEFNLDSMTPEDGTVAIYDPFMNEWQYISNKLPNFYEYYDLDRSRWLVDYSSSLDRVVYLGQINGQGIGSILWDTNLQKVVWQTDQRKAIIKTPRWAPSKNIVAVIKDDHLFLIDQDGKVNTSPGLGEEFEIMNISWSPDGNYIAMLVRSTNSDRSGGIFLYDVRYNQIIDYCIKNDDTVGIFSPLWSENSQYVVFDIIENYSDGPRNKQILIDIKEHQAHQIAEDFYPLEWVSSKP
jgi:WD40 repeat protein